MDKAALDSFITGHNGEDSVRAFDAGYEDECEDCHYCIDSVDENGLSHECANEESCDYEEAYYAEDEC